MPNISIPLYTCLSTPVVKVPNVEEKSHLPQHFQHTRVASTYKYS